MAILKGPLFSVDARGKLADSLVYMIWKGINDVRKYVVPANPKSDLQTTQRGYMTSTVALWHSTAFNAADLAAFSNWAAVESKAMSGFNRFVKDVVNAYIASETIHPTFALAVSDVTSSGFKVAATGETGDTYTLYYGKSPTNMHNEAVVTNTDGALTATLGSLDADTPYYFYIENTTATTWGRTGIVKQRTTAA